jgi:hypothetical protein
VHSSSTSSSNRRFAIKLIAFLVAVFALDAGVGAVLRHYYFRQTSGLSYRTTYAITQSSEDLVVLGSSRAQANYVPEIFTEHTQMSVYNAGRDGQSILYARALQEAMFTRHHPKTVVLDLIPIDFYYSRGHYDYLAALLPYCKDYPGIRTIVQLRGKWERVRLLSQIYPFNSLILQIAKYNLSKGTHDSGYVPLHGTLKLPVPDKDFIGPRWASGDLDGEMVDALAKILRDCRDANVRLVIVISPVYKGILFGESNLDLLRPMLTTNDCEIWDYSDYVGISDDPKLFRDVGHLNEQGAKEFSRLVAMRIGSESRHESVSEHVAQ